MHYMIYSNSSSSEIYNFFHMNDLAQLLLVSNTAIDPSITKELRFNHIYSHLQERNANNKRFISKFLSKI